MSAPKDAWPEEQFEYLKAVWSEGVSGSEAAKLINAKFRTTYTRNAVIGKVHRSDLPKRQSDIRLVRVRVEAAYRAKLPKPPRQKVTRALMTAQIGGPVRSNPVELKVSNAQLNAEVRAAPPVEVVRRERAFAPISGCAPVPFGRGGCKWPVGEDSDGMLCCGRPRDGAKPYCASHAAAAFVKPATKPNEFIRSLRRWAA
jgi:GcrA cell cycle regulator